MAEEEEAEPWDQYYGPPAHNAPYHAGQTLVYQDTPGRVENGEILYVAQDSAGETTQPLYIVSPAQAGFPAPVWPRQILACLP